MLSRFLANNHRTSLSIHGDHGDYLFQVVDIEYYFIRQPDAAAYVRANQLSCKKSWHFFGWDIGKYEHLSLRRN